jgi:hypothetical protein
MNTIAKATLVWSIFGICGGSAQVAKPGTALPLDTTRATIGDGSYLLNLTLNAIALDDVPDPQQGLTPLARLLPGRSDRFRGRTAAWEARHQQCALCLRLGSCNS